MAFAEASCGGPGAASGITFGSELFNFMKLALEDQRRARVFAEDGNDIAFAKEKDVSTRADVCSVPS
jgi:hypothetical protein